MSADLTPYLPLILLALVALVLAAWIITRLNRKARVVDDASGAPIARDVLADGAAPAARNQALIDAPRSIEIIQGPLSAAANAQPTAAATMETDAEAGPAITPNTAAPDGDDDYLDQYGPIPSAVGSIVAQLEAEEEAKKHPAPTPTPTPAPVDAVASGNDLTRIKGLGPKLAALLGELGVTTFAQIAAWDAADVERIDTQLGRFSGRITRDQWIAQAKLLAAGDESGFAAQFGRNG